MSASRRFFVFTLTLLALLRASSASADLLVGDSYDDKALGQLAGQSGGYNSTAAWTGAYSADPLAISGITVVSGGLSYSSGSVFVEGGAQSVRMNNLGAGVIEAALARSFTTQSGPVYFSFLFRAGQTPDISSTNGDFVQFLLNNDTAEPISGSIGMGRTDTNNPFFSRVGTTTSGDQDLSSVLAQNAATYLLVGRFEKVASTNYNQMSLWVNPSSLIETSPLTTSVFNSGTSSLSFLTVRTAGLASDVYFFDELRIGTTFDSVVVPEPSTWALCGLAAAGWLVRRRWRKR